MKKYVLLVSLFTFFTSHLFGQSFDAKLLSELKFRYIGVDGNRAIAVVGEPGNPMVSYIGAASGGIWKTEDAGYNWKPVFDDQDVCAIGSLAIAPSNPKHVWAGTGETWTRNSVSVGDGIYKSTDGGLNWTNMGLPKSERISSIIVDPRDSNNVWVGVLGALWGDSEERGIYNSKDGGKTWNKVHYIDNKTGCSDLVIDPTNPNVMYASFWEFRRTPWSFNSGGNSSALLKTTDGGKTWNKIHNGFPAGKLGRFAIAVAPSNANILYSVIECEKDSEKGLYKSEDAGKSWKHLNSDFALVVRPFYFSRISIDPKNPDIV